MAVTRDDQLLCVTEYSRIVPLENGEVSGFGRQSGEGLERGQEAMTLYFPGDSVDQGGEQCFGGNRKGITPKTQNELG